VEDDRKDIYQDGLKTNFGFNSNNFTANNNSFSEDLEKNYLYLLKNGENLTDPDIISSCKKEQNRDIIDNARLGSYDKYGNYLFLPEIRFELINIPKFIYHFSTKEDKKIFDIKTIVPIFGEIFFKLTVRETEAVLYLVETVSREGGEYLEVYEEVVDALAIGESNPLKIDDIFSIYHIYEKMKHKKINFCMTMQTY